MNNAPVFANNVEIIETENEIILSFKFKTEGLEVDSAKIAVNLSTAQDLIKKMKIFTMERPEIRPQLPKVLIVEDNDKYRREMYNYLIQNNYEVACASNGDMAVKAVNRFRPDIILMDHIMPVLNGLDSARIIKQNPNNHDIKIYLMLGYGKVTDFNDFVGHVIHDLVQKPISLSELKLELEKFCT